MIARWPSIWRGASEEASIEALQQRLALAEVLRDLQRLDEARATATPVVDSDVPELSARASALLRELPR